MSNRVKTVGNLAFLCEMWLKKANLLHVFKHNKRSILVKSA